MVVVVVVMEMVGGHGKTLTGAVRDVEVGVVARDAVVKGNGHAAASMRIEALTLKIEHTPSRWKQMSSNPQWTPCA